MAAQRYPELFDGIFGGAGVLNLSQNGAIFGSWVVQANTHPDGGRILDHRFGVKLPTLEAAILKQCDATDGSTDGVIAKPRRCTVDVEALPRCGGVATEECFTEAEVGVLRKWYGGPRDSAGKQLFPGMPPGSERFMGFWFLDPEGGVAVGNQLGGAYAKYLGFPEETAADYTALDFDFDADPARIETTGRQLNALDPDLTAFRDAGGKYLMWHGWADPLVLPDQSLAYYESVAQRMGGLEAVDDFFRLFMIPGHGHCWELPAALPDEFNPISILERWVEFGEAPQVLSVGDSDASSESVDRSVCAHGLTC